LTKRGGKKKEFSALEGKKGGCLPALPFRRVARSLIHA